MRRPATQRACHVQHADAASDRRSGGRDLFGVVRAGPAEPQCAVELVLVRDEERRLGSGDLDALPRQRGVEVRERAIWPEELESFQQMFLTGTAVEITPVRSVGPWNFEVGDLTRQLAKDYENLVNGRISNT